MKNLLTFLLLLLCFITTAQPNREIVSFTCDSSEYTIKQVSDYPPSYEYLDTLNYCYSIDPPAMGFTLSFTFIATSPSIVIQSGFSVIGCIGSSFTGASLYDLETCTQISGDYVFNDLVIGHTYNWILNGQAYGLNCSGFSTICPYYLDNLNLPIELSLFQGTYTDEGIALNWITNSETNSNYYVIEKTEGFDEFLAIYRVNSSINSSNIKQYNFVDKYPYPGNNYYRIKEVSLNGNIHYFDPICVYYPYTIKELEVYDILGRKSNLFTTGFKIAIDKQNNKFYKYIIE